MEYTVSKSLKPDEVLIEMKKLLRHLASQRRDLATQIKGKSKKSEAHFIAGALALEEAANIITSIKVC